MVTNEKLEKVPITYLASVLIIKWRGSLNFHYDTVQTVDKNILKSATVLLFMIETIYSLCYLLTSEKIAITHSAFATGIRKVIKVAAKVSEKHIL